MLRFPRNPGWLALVAVTAFLLRPVSYRLVLDRVDPRRFPFDQHGYGLLLDVAVHAAAVPLLGYALYRILWRRRDGTDPHRRAVTPGGRAVSWLLMLAAGSPSPAQWDALRALPLALAWPVLLSATLWFAVAAALREAALARHLAAAR